MNDPDCLHLKLMQSKGSVSAKLQLLVVLLIATITAKGETVRLEDEKLTFTLPPGWVAIPQHEMAQRNAETQRSLAKPYQVNFKYGYQVLGLSGFLFFTCLLNRKLPEDRQSPNFVE